MTKITSNKMLPPVSIEPGPPNNLWFQIQHCPFWANMTFACNTETLGNLYSHALLVLTKIQKSSGAWIEI